MAARWTRIWWVRPVSSRQASRLATGAASAPGERPGTARPLRHLVAGAGVAVDWLVDGAARPVRCPPDEREVAPPQRPGAAVVGELRAEGAVGVVGLGDHHQPGGVLVEAMHDAGPPDAAHTR